MDRGNRAESHVDEPAPKRPRVELKRADDATDDMDETEKERDMPFSHTRGRPDVPPAVTIASGFLDAADSMSFRSTGLTQTTSRTRTPFTLISGPTNHRKNADVHLGMLKTDPTTLQAFGIGVSASALAHTSLSVEISGITMLAPLKNRDVIFRDHNLGMIINRTNNHVSSVCIAVMTPETGIKLGEKQVVQSKLASPSRQGLKEVEIVEYGGNPECPLLLYCASSMALMNPDMATRAWNAVKKIVPTLYAKSMAETYDTGYVMDKSGNRYTRLHIDRCGILNDILLTAQDYSEQHRDDKLRSKMLNCIIEVTARPSMGMFVPGSIVEISTKELTDIWYMYGRKIE